MVNLKIREWKICDAQYLLPRLRKSDIDEWYALSDTPISKALEISVSNSTMLWVCDVNKKPAIVFGVCPANNSILNMTGRVWLVGTDEIRKIALPFVRKTNGYVERMLSEYSVLENWVDTRNTISRRWLKYAGFSQGQAMPIGRNKELFHKFWRYKKCV